MLAALVRRLSCSTEIQQGEQQDRGPDEETLRTEEDSQNPTGTAGCRRRRSGSWPEAVRGLWTPSEVACELRHEPRRGQVEVAEPRSPTGCELTDGGTPYFHLSEDSLCAHHKLSRRRSRRAPTWPSASYYTEPTVRSKLPAVDEIASDVTALVSAATSISALTVENLRQFDKEDAIRHGSFQEDDSYASSSSSFVTHGRLPLTQENLQWHNEQLK